MKRVIREAGETDRKRRGLAVVALLIALFSLPAAVAHCLTVVYPLAQPPYRASFEQIVSGIAARSPWPLERVVVGDKRQRAADLGPCLARIGLGRAGVRLLDSVQETVPHLLGAVEARQGTPLGGTAAISLSPAPSAMLTRLRHFAPHVRNVHLLFDPAHDGGWVDRAARSAALLGFNLITYETDEDQSAVAIYRHLLASIGGGGDALWLGATTSAEEVEAVLPVILRQAWKHHVVLFSSLPGLARRGVLFSVSPDYERLGHDLVALAKRCISTLPDCTGLHPLNALKTTFNQRTARHLGLSSPARNDPYVDRILTIGDLEEEGGR